LTASKPSATRRRIRRCPRRARLVQLMRVLKGQWGLSTKQIARRMKVSENSARLYIGNLMETHTILINFKYRDLNSKRPVFYYALKGTK
jgi:response regulator of citrate/malate metabolism